MGFLRAWPSLIPCVFALLAFIFSLLAITSSHWASRSQYANDTDVTTQFKPIYTLYRSPFQTCTVNITANATIPANNTDEDGNDLPPPPISYNYTVECERYRAFGFNRTSCELATATNSNFVPQLGDRRLCSQIHWAGNYSIASTTFISTSFVLILFMTTMAFLTANGIDSAAGSESVATEKHHVRAKSGDVHETMPGIEHGSHSHHQHGHEHHTDRKPPAAKFTILPYVNLLIVTFSFIGIATALLAQFYGVLAFTQSAPNNAEFSTSQGNREKHDPWVQGKALSVYMTLSWAFATVAGFSAFAVWRFPIADKVI